MVHEFEGSEGELSGFMVQVLELLQKLNKKVDNASTRLMFLEKKVRLLRMGKEKIEEDVKEDDEEEDKNDEKEEDDREGEK